MNDFVNDVNRRWAESDPFLLAAFCLWRLNYIHPFINGNGRVARALCYYVLCGRSAEVTGRQTALLPGHPIVPELIQRNRAEYVRLLQDLHDAHNSVQVPDIVPMSQFLARLILEQMASAGPSR